MVLRQPWEDRRGGGSQEIGTYSSGPGVGKMVWGSRGLTSILVKLDDIEVENKESEVYGTNDQLRTEHEV